MKDHALWVDLDGTLIDYDDATRRAAAEFIALHRTWRHVDAIALANTWQASRRTFKLDGSRPLHLQRAIRMAGIARQFDVRSDDATAEDWAQQLSDLAVTRCRPYPDVDDFLERAGPVGVITNGERTFQQAKLTAAGLDPADFDPFIASMQVGAAKPSPAIYLAAAQARGIAPSQCVMIGDSPRADVAAARSAGYAAAILVDRSAIPRPDSAPSLVAALARLRPTNWAS